MSFPGRATGLLLSLLPFLLPATPPVPHPAWGHGPEPDPHVLLQGIAPAADERRATAATPTPARVRIAYLVPVDREPQPDAVWLLQVAFLNYQNWYRDQMERHGFGPKTFHLEMEPDGRLPQVHVVRSPRTADYLRGDLWGRVAEQLTQQGFPVWTARTVWFVIPEAHVQQPDSSVLGGFAGGASFGSGDDAGLAVLGSDALPRFRPALLRDNRSYANRVLPEIGPRPLRQGVTFPGFEGTSFSSTCSSALGAGLHELSHGFGLSHDFRNDDNFRGVLMGNGLRGFRGETHPGAYRSDQTQLSHGHALALNVSRYFNPAATAQESTRPTLTVLTRGPQTPDGGLLTVRFRAADNRGLAAALLTRNGDLIEEMPLSGTIVTQQFATTHYEPGEPNTYRLALFDAAGNKAETEFQVTPASGLNRAPRPFVKLSPDVAAVGQTFTLEATASSDPDDPVTSLTVEWDLDGDGTFDTAPVPQKRLLTNSPLAGVRRIRARLTDPHGASAISAPVSLRVVDAATTPPALALSLDPDPSRGLLQVPIPAGHAVQFQASTDLLTWSPGDLPAVIGSGVTVACPVPLAPTPSGTGVFYRWQLHR